MVTNLLEGFSDWMKQHMNVGAEDFAQIGNIPLANVELTPDNGEPIFYKALTMFELWSNKDGTVYKLKDVSAADDKDSKKAEFPHASASPHVDKVFTLTKDEYEKLIRFPRTQQQQLGMGF